MTRRSVSVKAAEAAVVFKPIRAWAAITGRGSCCTFDYRLPIVWNRLGIPSLKESCGDGVQIVRVEIRLAALRKKKGKR
jgi:hypothetical protein